MEVSFVRPDQHDSVVDLLRELYEFYNAPSTVDPAVVRAHLLNELLAPSAPMGLVVAADGDLVLGLAAIEVQHSLVEPDPVRARQLYMKELYVRGDARSRGIGRTLMEWVARYAVDQGCHRIDWTVHRDNDRGIAFYESLGAHRVEIRRNLRIEGEALVALAESRIAPPSVRRTLRRPDLILLNGPPASGKSTLGAALVESRHLALLLDIDVLRGQLGRWDEDPVAAGLTARRLALAMIGEHLRAGHDVVVPQLLVREEFLLELEQAAQAHGARFVEIALVLDRDDAIEAFEQRSADPSVAVHVVAAMLVERDGGRAELERLHDAYTALLDGRDDAVRIDVVMGDRAGTLERVESAIGRRAGTMEE